MEVLAKSREASQCEQEDPHFNCWIVTDILPKINISKKNLLDWESIDM